MLAEAAPPSAAPRRAFELTEPPFRAFELIEPPFR
jgi:hypothetical protein